MSPLASYRRLFSLAGPLYVLIAFVGRLPLAMSQMGSLLLVSSATGSYGAGGLTAGALAVANALCAPYAGGLADRLGQRPVVLVQSLVASVGLVVLVALTHAGAETPVLVFAAAVAGAFAPQVGPLARVRWRPIAAGQGPAHTRLVETAFSYEGAADEASFVLGPALLGVLVAVAAPEAGLLTAAGLLAVFGTAFALHPTADLTHRARHTTSSGARLVTTAFVVLFTGQLLIGVVFGSVQAGTTVLATAAGHPGVAGLVHATLGIGSVLAGLAVAGLPEHVTHARRVLVSAAGLMLLSLPLLAVDSVGALFWVVLVLGFVVAPYMISNFTLGERAAPVERVGAAMTLLASATGLGYALGSATAGRLADAAGHSGAFAVTVTAGAFAFALAVLSRALLTTLVRRPAQATPEGVLV